jgi:putative hydrolase of the HAD superfamily
MTRSSVVPVAEGRAHGSAFAHVETWVFDLDNTLYPATCRLFDQIDRRMGAFIAARFACDAAEARTIQKGLFRKYGTTMRGLMTEHGVDPDAFLAFVHDIDYGPVPAMPALDLALAALDGRKIVFTNASIGHAERVLARLGVGRHFEATFDIVAAGYAPKPDPATYRRLVEVLDFDPRRAVLIDDIPQNLKPARELGMTTVLVETETEYARIGAGGDHVQHTTDDLPAWVAEIAAARREKRRE